MSEIRYVISEDEAIYMDRHKGHFSKKLAEWAISMMEKEDEDGEMEKITPFTLEDVEDFLKENKVEIKEECLYDCWYLANMAKAYYLGSCLADKTHIALYVKDTICDPGGCPEMVLACFRAKCDVKNIPIHWERFL